MFWLGSLVAMIVISAATWASYALQDPHLMQRGGALLAALAAMLVVFEALLERRMDEHSTKSPSQVGVNNLLGRAVADLSNRISQMRFRSHQKTLSRRKLIVVFFNSVLAVFGEILHGFGDIFFERLSLFLW